MAYDKASLQDWGKLFLRLSVGGLMLFHGVDKLLNGIGGIEQMVVDHGLPAELAYGVYVGEILAPLAILLGVLVRLSSLVVVINMAVAIGLAHTGDLLELGAHGEWALETPAMYLLGALALSFLGGGRLALGRG
jgi:putative oxidoreductase